MPDLALEPQHDNYSLLKNHMLTVGDIKDTTEFNSLFTSLLSGDVILLLDRYAKGFTIGMRGWKDRGFIGKTSHYKLSNVIIDKYKRLRRPNKDGDRLSEKYKNISYSVKLILSYIFQNKAE
jgi:hypothetical protein